MSPPTVGDMVSLKAGQAVIVERVDNLKIDLNQKHLQNRNDIHQIRNNQQEFAEELWKLKVKVAMYAGAGSGSVAIVVELIKFLIHKS